MVRCQEFKQWLNDQGVVDEDTLRQLMAHAGNCQPCSELHQTDMALDDILKKGMPRVKPPAGLLARAKNRCRAQDRPRTIMTWGAFWKTALPVSAMATLLLIFVLNPFTSQLGSVDEVAAHSIDNHLNARLEAAHFSTDVTQLTQRLTRRLGHDVRLPDLSRMGLKLIGGRKCSLGKIKAAFISCDGKGGRASLFIIQKAALGSRMNDHRRYIIQDGDHTVTVWQESETVYALVT